LWSFADIGKTTADKDNNANRKRTMTSRHEARISGTQENGFFALVVRIDRDGEENVIHGYKGRTFKTREAAVKSTAKYMQSL